MLEIVSVFINMLFLAKFCEWSLVIL